MRSATVQEAVAFRMEGGHPMMLRPWIHTLLTTLAYFGIRYTR